MQHRHYRSVSLDDVCGWTNDRTLALSDRSWETRPTHESWSMKVIMYQYEKWAEYDHTQWDWSPLKGILTPVVNYSTRVRYVTYWMFWLINNRNENSINFRLVISGRQVIGYLEITPCIHLLYTWNNFEIYQRSQRYSGDIIPDKQTVSCRRN